MVIFNILGILDPLKDHQKTFLCKKITQVEINSDFEALNMKILSSEKSFITVQGKGTNVRYFIYDRDFTELGTGFWPLYTMLSHFAAFGRTKK